MGLFSKNTSDLDDTVEAARSKALKATRGAGDTVSSAAKALGGLIDDLEKTLRGARASDANDVQDSLRSRLDTVRASLNGAGSTMTRSVNTALDQADDVVRGNPWQSVGVIAAAALLIGFLVGRS